MYLRVFILAVIALLSAPSLSKVQADVGPCQVFPADNYWNRDISAEPVHPQSAAIISTINGFGQDNVHPDFGGDVNDWYGIPWTTVTNSQPNTDDIAFEYDDESDPGPYPIPYNVAVEGGPGAGGDRHVIVINTDTCMLYELFAAEFTGDTGDGNPNTWEAGSGAIWNLNTNAFRSETWTSADAAGLPIFPGLARCDEVMSGEINHAFRFTTSRTRDMYIYPATHEASSYTNALYPPMGMRIRLRADYNISGFGPQAEVIATAMKRYGMILADNGSNWYFSGEYNPACWDDDDLNDLKGIPGTAFEVLAYPGSSAPSLNNFTTVTPALRWARLTWAIDYQIEVATTTSFASPSSYTAPGTSVQVTVPAEGRYYWRVRGRDAAGTPGAWSTTGTFTVFIP
jgi:hypothetical protein